MVALLHAWRHFTPPPEDAATLSLGVFLVGLGGSNLLWLAAGAEPALVRRAAVWNVLVVGALVAVFGAYRVAPPFITLAVVWMPFVFAAILPRRGGGSA